MLRQLLGGLTPERFLASHWQKKPLLVRQALPGFAGVVSTRELLDLSLRDDVESRLVECRGGQWSVTRGPLARRDLRRRPHPWTVLVQGVNLHVAAADRLLRKFSFLPWARLDDLMISYAVDGGGVGPHFDSYDVFLIQAGGRRRWRIGAQRDLSLVPGAPLKILARFTPSEEWIVEPGDMLYLPPHYAHDGLALGECVTCSVGFRAPSARELARGFLAYLEERVELKGMYRDPELARPRHPARIGEAMVSQVEKMLSGVRWTKADVRDFLGRQLSEPKPHVFFEPPSTPLSRGRFLQAWARSGLELDRRTQLLFSGARFFLNGETVEIPACDRSRLAELADLRRLAAPQDMSEAGLDLIYEWYRCGFVLPGEATS
jgi:50S ribosomal protein L16 3-hydroxylase